MRPTTRRRKSECRAVNSPRVIHLHIRDAFVNIPNCFCQQRTETCVRGKASHLRYCYLILVLNGTVAKDWRNLSFIFENKLRVVCQKLWLLAPPTTCGLAYESVAIYRKIFTSPSAQYKVQSHRTNPTRMMFQKNNQVLCICCSNICVHEEDKPPMSTQCRASGRAPPPSHGLAPGNVNHDPPTSPLHSPSTPCELTLLDKAPPPPSTRSSQQQYTCIVAQMYVLSISLDLKLKEPNFASWFQSRHNKNPNDLDRQTGKSQETKSVAS